MTVDAPGPAGPRRIALVGMPGAGKTTVGRKLARTLGLPFYDTDQLIELAEGRPIPEIFANEGETYFRRREEDIIAKALTHPEGVISLGGGAVLSETTRRRLANIDVIHLMISVAEGARRSGGGSRPLLAGNDVTARYQALHTERAPLYKDVATYSTSTERRSTGKVVAEIVAALYPELSGTVELDDGGIDSDET